MLLVVLTVVALLTVPVFGGRLGRLAHVRLRGVWVLVAALVSQVVIISVLPDGDVTIRRVLHLVTYVAVLAWVALNTGLRWRWTVLAGGVLNFVVIAANNGVMPASPAAVRAAGIGGRSGFENSVPVADPVLGFLGDIFAVPASWPLHNVFSIGDGLIVVGVFLLLHRVCESYLAYLLARGGDALLRGAAHLGVPTLGAWRMTASPGPSRRSTRRTPPIPIAS